TRSASTTTSRPSLCSRTRRRRRFHTIRRLTLIALRALTLVALFFVLFKPMVVWPRGSAAAKAVVPVVVDISRSMRLADAGSGQAGAQARIARATDVVGRQLLPALSGRFDVELFGAGVSLGPASLSSL